MSDEIVKTEEMKGSTEAKWYVIHTYSGYENKVKDNIIKTVKSRGMEDQILHLSVPEIESTENKETKIKDGDEEVKKVSKRKPVIKKTKLFPSYVFIHMMMNDETWYIVRNTRGVTSFVGPGSKPVPLSVAEVKNMSIESYALKTDYDENDPDSIMMPTLIASDTIDIGAEVGDYVRVISGSFADSEGCIQEIIPQKNVLIVNLSVFGRDTPVELDFTQIEKI